MDSLRKKGVLYLVVVIALAIVGCMLVTGCSDKKKESFISSADIAYLEEIQATGALKFEWLNNYSPSRPTAIVFHGESDGNKFSIDLDSNEYTFKKDADDKNYVVYEGIGLVGKGLNLKLSEYWTKDSEWNLAVFHWESFAREDNADDIVAKFYSLPKMRYYLGEDMYETSKVPHNNLTEVVSALYYEEMQDKINGKEIRFIGNGVGADLALSVAAYLSASSAKGLIGNESLPLRIALCDPYISVGDMNMPGNVLPWTSVSTAEGMIKVTEELLKEVASYGAAAEIIEMQEVVSVQNGSDSVETVAYAYDIEKSEKAEESYKSIKANSAHLYLRESYSSKFSEGYKKLKRVALDWYMYSIIGSDDSGNAGGQYSIGYPHNVSDFQTYYSYSGFNWGPNKTRPMINNRALNNDTNSSVSGNRGKNFSVSAWTPTPYVRAVRGISFTQQKKVGTSATGTNIHGNSLYAMKDYTLEYFRSENYQVSDQTDYTLVCGYVYTDKNKDGYMNDGFSGVANAKLSVEISRSNVSSDEKTTIASFIVNADETGFYVIKLADKKKDSEGVLSEEGYSFSSSHVVKLTLIPESHDYYGITSAVTGQPYYNTINAHNFSGFSTEITVSNYYADAITISNCLVRANEN